MSQYLRTYQLELTVKGPVFIGSGKSLSKKEYLIKGDRSNPFQKVQVIDINKFYHYLEKRKLGERFEDYFLNGWQKLSQWLQNNRINEREIERMIRYELPCGDTALERGTSETIMEFVKDPYGKPYVPGSSVKGMLRTILISYLYQKDPEKYTAQKQNLQQASEEIMQRASGKRVQRTKYLKRETEAFENQALYTLQRDIKSKGSAVNDMLAGIIVGDSEPLRIEDLVLCQKVDRDTDGKTHNINILRECLKPGTIIRVPLSIDTTLCDISKEDIEEAVKEFIDQYYRNFLLAFKNPNRLMDDRVYLGGGAGYVSKTFTYPVYGKREGMDVAMNVFSATLPPKVNSQHKHYKDGHLGASPHIMKCTRYEGRLCQMGLCQLKVLEQQAFPPQPQNSRLSGQNND